MTKQADFNSRYFDPEVERQNLTNIWREHEGNDGAVRAAALKHVIALYEHARAEAERGLLKTSHGRTCARELSQFQDELIKLIYDFTTRHIYRAQNPSDAERITIVATGGYGRGLLAPGSDIDLLFILPYKQTSWGESVIEYMLYLLWDMGFKVGHATRTVEQCLRYAKEDMTVRTASIDSRFIYGDDSLFKVFMGQLRDKVVKGTAQAFIEAKLEEREERHRQSGSSRYMVEPNIKDGKGGLRDLHLMHWIATYLNFAKDEDDLVKAQVFSADEYHQFLRAEDFLWTIRCHLHFLTNRAEERLSFDLQLQMAERLGYADREGLRAVERFMKHYFLVAKDVGDLTRILCANLEMQQLKKAPKLSELFQGHSWRHRMYLTKATDFKMDNGRLNVEHSKAFQHDPVNLVRIFKVANDFNVSLHPNALRLIRQSLRLITPKLRRNLQVNEIFLELITSKGAPDLMLRLMNETGVLGKLVPDFGRIVCMMQFNMYHHYTVDEHLIRAVGILPDIEHGKLDDALPLSTEIFPTIQHRRTLYVTVLLHDIAKGRPEDHSVAGAKVALKLCPRFGLDKRETELCAWLIQEHLTMSNFAQTRDLGDPKTISDFAAIVRTKERLDLLLVLTVVDIMAVGPGVWNGWKGQLLRTLYHETLAHIEGDALAQTKREQADQLKARVAAKLPDWSEDMFEAFESRFYDDYWQRLDEETILRHARLVASIEAGQSRFGIDVKVDQFTHHTSLMLYCEAHPKLLAMIAGACFASGANIIDAQTITTRDGLALDTVAIQNAFDENEDEVRRAQRIGTTIKELIHGEKHLHNLAQDRRQIKGRLQAFDVPPKALIDNERSAGQTVIEVSALDRPGLLFDVTMALGELNLTIESAHIATYGEKAKDVFYVTDLTGKKIRDVGRMQRIQQELISVLSGDDAKAQTA